MHLDKRAELRQALDGFGRDVDAELRREVGGLLLGEHGPHVVLALVNRRHDHLRVHGRAAVLADRLVVLPHNVQVDLDILAVTRVVRDGVLVDRLQLAGDGEAHVTDGVVLDAVRDAGDAVLERKHLLVAAAGRAQRHANIVLLLSGSGSNMVNV